MNVNNIFATGITIRVEIDGEPYGPYFPDAKALIFVTPGSVAQVWSITDNLYLQFDQAGWSGQHTINSDVTYNIKWLLGSYVEIIY